MTAPNLAQTPLIENWHAGGFLVSEARGHRARDIGTLSGATKILPGTVLGFKTGADVAAWPGNSEQVNTNTGNGAFTLAGTPATSAAQHGYYHAICTAAAANGGTFAVTDPFGNSLGNATVGTAFSNQIAFTIADGATDFAVGDEFTIFVEAIAGVFEPLNPSATDGTQTAAGIAFDYTDVTLNDLPGTVVVRECEVNGSELVWPSGITAAQIATATTQLTSLGIITR